MNREQILAAIRLQIEQERRHGIGYWCDPDLAAALGGVTAGGSSGAGVRSARRMGAARSANDPPAAAPMQTPVGGSRSALPPRAARGDRLSERRQGVQLHGRLSPAAPRTKAAAPARPTWAPPPMAIGREPDWEKKLAALESEARSCRLCGLREGCNSVVFGVGAAGVPLVFVGEAPGAEEDRQGLPFVGRGGELLTRIIAAIGLTREQVYICNVLKCRPPGNRDPHPDEVATCAPYLERQLALLMPKVICTLGRYSTMLLTGQNVAMKAIRGQVFTYHGRKVVPTYHPAALLRNPSLKAMVWEDVQKVRSMLDAP